MLIVASYRYVLCIQVCILSDVLYDFCSVQGEFTESGVETHFTIGPISAIITSESSGNKKKGLLYKLLVDGTSLEPVKEQ